MFASFPLKKIYALSGIALLVGSSFFVAPLVKKTFSYAALELQGKNILMAFASVGYRIRYAFYAARVSPDISAARMVSFIPQHTSVQTSPSANSIPALLYHGIGTNSVSGDQTKGPIPLDTFVDQMFALKAAGYNTITLEDMRLFLAGQKNLPDKSFILTFDDGRKDSYYPVDPVLRALDWHAINFVIARFALEESSSYYLNRHEISRMIRSGRWEIQSHGDADHQFYHIDESGTLGLFLPNKLWKPEYSRMETTGEFTSRVSADLIKAKYSLEETFLVPVMAFAYPYSDYGQGSLNFPAAQTIVPATVNSIYQMALYQSWNGNYFPFNYPDTDARLIKRIEVPPVWDGNALVRILDAYREKNLPYIQNSPFQTNVWSVNWGRAYTDEHGLFIVGSETNGAGSMTFLEGSFLWRNYQFFATIVQSNGRSIAVVARFQDSKHYVACNYTGDLVHIDQVLGGISKTIKGERLPHGSYPRASYTIGIRVYGRSVRCTLNGIVVARTDYLDSSLDHGGIGIKTWDTKNGVSNAVIEYVRAEDI